MIFFFRMLKRLTLMMTVVCIIVLMGFRPTIATRFSRLIEFNGGAIDDLSSASTPARNLVIRSNFKVRFQIPCYTCFESFFLFFLPYQASGLL